MNLPLTTGEKAAAVSLGDIAATTLSVGTFSLDGHDPLIAYRPLGNTPSQPAIIQRIGAPLTASALAQANTPPPIAPSGSAPPISPLAVIPGTPPVTVPPFTNSTLANSPGNVESGISPTVLIVGVVLLLFIFFK